MSDLATVQAELLENKPYTRLLSQTEVMLRVPVTYPTLRDLMRRRGFPRARQVGGKSFWVGAEVEAWIQNLPIRTYREDADSND
jgi:predicted DNA-binding transcriptional regulator AlpA